MDSSTDRSLPDGSMLFALDACDRVRVLGRHGLARVLLLQLLEELEGLEGCGGHVLQVRVLTSLWFLHSP